MERLALELNALEEELIELEKDEIPNVFEDEFSSKNQISEVNLLRQEMYKILGSEAFRSIEGRSAIE